MKRMTAAALLIMLLASMALAGPFSAGAAAVEEPGTWHAGTAAYPVTPLQEHLDKVVYLGGYGAGPFRGAATGVRDEVWARALALSCGGETVVLVVMDLPGISCNDIADIRGRVGGEAGIPGSNVIVSVTHTHSGPDMVGLFGGVPPEYRDYLRNQAVRAGVEAVLAMRPAVLYTASADRGEDVRNRREAPYLDPALHVLRAASTEGETIATLVVFGVHTTWLGASNLLVSADLAGPLVAALEEELGGTALFAAGIEGDQTPWKGNRTMEQYGRDLASAAVQALEVSGAEVAPAFLELRQKQFKLNVRNSMFILAGLLGFMSEYRFGFDLKRGLYVTPEVSYIRLGEQIGFATVPGEIVARLGLEIKEMGGIDRTVVLGLANGTYGYFVHEKDWLCGIPFITMGYEESASMGKHAGPEVRKRLGKLIQAY